MSERAKADARRSGGDGGATWRAFEAKLQAEQDAAPSVLSQSADEILADDQQAEAHVKAHTYHETTPLTASLHHAGDPLEEMRSADRSIEARQAIYVNRRRRPFVAHAPRRPSCCGRPRSRARRTPRATRAGPRSGSDGSDDGGEPPGGCSGVLARPRALLAGGAR